MRFVKPWSVGVGCGLGLFAGVALFGCETAAENNCTQVEADGCGSAGAAGEAGEGGSGGSSGASGTGGSGGDGGGGSGGSGGSGAPEWSFEFLEDAGDGWQVLLKADWELEAHTETYRCVRFTVPETVSLVRFKPLAPPGTHHTTLGVHATPAFADGIEDCDTTLTGDRRLMGSGVGTEASDPFPAGVAMELQAGNQLVMNLHLFNVGDELLRGTSGMLVQVGEPAEPDLAASTMLAGPLQLNIPTGQSVQKGSCTFGAKTTLFAIGPHMHQLGTHLKATAVRDGQADQVLFDAAYDFDRQVGHAIEPITMEAGDRLEVECTYENPGSTVGFGESTLDEMCFASAAFYPASAYPGTFPCFN